MVLYEGVDTRPGVLAADQFQSAVLAEVTS